MPALNEQELAARYGWALSVLNSDPSLRQAFDRAVAETWAPDRFVAEVRNTPWYKNNSEAMRQAAVLKNSDPATWNQRVEQTYAEIFKMGAQMGAVWNPTLVRQIADQALTFGWNQQQISNTIAQYVQSNNGQLHGQAAQIENELWDYAHQMGVRLDPNTVMKMVKDEVSGLGTIDGSKAWIQNQAESAFPHLAERIRAGETVAQIASPYRQAMGQILEINPESVDVFDPTIRGALAGQGQDGKPAMKTIWQFESDLRKDNRWLKTNNAREQAMGTARQVLTDFGLAV